MRIFVAVMAVWVAVPGALAGEPGQLAANAAVPATSPDANPLTGLPSPTTGPHIDAIKALGDNSWAILGRPAPDPRWGKEGEARGRSWCSKMAYAADLGGAFFCGTGQHGYVKSDGHYMDDLWFYDANAHKWICLYPGADTKTLKLHVDKNGLEVDDQGEHVPVSYLSHAYCNTTYNPDLRLYHVQWLSCPWWTKAIGDKRWDWLHIPADRRTYGNVGDVIRSPKHPLFWDVAKGKWERKFVAGDGPNDLFQGVAEYIPSLKKTLCINQGKVWFYDYPANTWTLAPFKVPESARGGYDSNACYDAKGNRLYVAEHKSFGYLDLAANKWQDVHAESQPEDLGCTNDAQMYFDAANDVVLWHKSHGPIAIYNPASNNWTDMGNTLPVAKIAWKNVNPAHLCFNGFYNAALNVHYFYMAGDSGLDGNIMLAYRYKKQATRKLLRPAGV